MPEYFTLTEIYTTPRSNTYATDGGPIIVDVDGDGHLDLVIPYVSVGSTNPVPVRFFRGDGLGGFTEFGSVLFPDGPPMLVGPGTAQLVADFNGDGRPDIFVNDWGYDAEPFPGAYNLLLLTGPSPGMFDASDRISSGNPENTYYASYADIDSDGDIDIFVGNAFARGEAYFLINDGLGNFTRTSDGLPIDAIGGPIPPDGVRNSLDFMGTKSAFVDVNGDGILDLLILPSLDDDPAFLLLGDGAGSFTQASLTLPMPENPNSFAEAILSGDLNGDGRDDLIISYQLESYTGGRTDVLINNGNGQFTDETAIRLIGGTLPDSSTYTLQWIDLNGDGVLDLFAGGGFSPDHPMQIYLGDGAGNFVYFPLDISRGVNGIQAADVNSDGRLDFIAPFSTGYLDDLLTQGVRVYLGVDAGLNQVGDASDNGLMGDGDNEHLSGLEGNDVIFGGGGNDTLSGGSGADYLNGGAGDDRFVGTAAELNGDTIGDFSIGDRIVITDASLASFVWSISGSTLTYPGGSLTLNAEVAGRIAVSAAPGGGVQLTHVPPPLATLTLTASGQDFTIGGDVLVYGTTAGGEVIELLHGDVRLDASFNLGGDTVVLPGNAASYTAVLAGSFVTIAGGGLVVAIPVGVAGLNVQFADSTRVLRFDTGAGHVVLGDQAVTSVEAPVAAIGAPLSDPVEVGPDSLGRLVLAEAGQDVDIGGNLSVFGSTAPGEVITILEGTIVLDASFNAGGDTVVLPGNAGSYSATLAGSFVTIAGGGISVSIPVGVVGLTVDFADADRVLRFDTGAGQVMLGDQVITSSGGSVSARLAMDAFAKDALADDWANELRLETVDSFYFG